MVQTGMRRGEDNRSVHEAEKMEKMKQVFKPSPPSTNYLHLPQMRQSARMGLIKPGVHTNDFAPIYGRRAKKLGHASLATVFLHGRFTLRGAVSPVVGRTLYTPAARVHLPGWASIFLGVKTWLSTLEIVNLSVFRMRQ